MSTIIICLIVRLDFYSKKTRKFSFLFTFPQVEITHPEISYTHNFAPIRHPRIDLGSVFGYSARHGRSISEKYAYSTSN